MKQPVKVLIVEDAEDDAKLALRALRHGGFDPTHRRVQTSAELETALAQERWDAVISDFSMPGFTGLDALKILRAAGLDIPFILISGTIGEETAVDAMKAGASDYLMKKSLARLAPALKRELKETQVRASHRVVQEALTDSEKRFRQLAENIRDVFFLLDAESNRILYISPAYEAIWGRSCESLYSNPESWTESMHPDDRASACEKFKKGVTEGKFDYGYRIVRPDGSIRWVEVRGFPVTDDIGKLVRIAGIVADVTQRKRAEQALVQFRRKSELILDSVGEGIYGIDMEGRIIFENPGAAELLGYSPGELSGRHSHPTMHYSRNDGTPYPIADCPMQLTMRDGAVRRVEDDVFWRKDGTSVPVDYTTAPIRNDRENITGAVIAFRDITDRKKAENRIGRLNRVYAVLSGINSAIVRIRDRRELFREACRIIVEHGSFTLGWIAVLDRATGMLTAVAQAGLPANAGAGRELFDGSVALVPGGTAEGALRQKHSAIDNDIEARPGRMNAENEPDTMEIRRAAIALGAKSVISLPLNVGGETFGILTLYAPERNFFDDEEIKLLNELAGDVSFGLEFIAKEEKEDYLAYYDALTGLANRSLFLERVAQYLRSAVSGGHRLALFFLDLERFRNINDSLGRPAGDALIKQVAEWLSRDAGDANLLARVGADHFAIVLPELKQEGNVARLLDKRIRAFLDHPFRLNDTEFRITIKVGVALFPNDGTDADTLLQNAESALKKAKASGDRYLFYTQKMTETVAGNLTLENQLRKALDNEEFVLHYQPKVNLVSGKLTGAEALIRWDDPGTGLVPPGRFIPILEQTGLIHEVGRWALRKAIEDYLRWRAAGLAAVRVAVNVSPLQLRSRGFIAEIEHAIGIDPRAAAGLELEITESLVMEDVKRSIASLQAIRAMGASIAIDDFGTGFSSLNYLAKLPVDTLKIDQSFVRDMTGAPEGLALVSTIINLAHSLKLKVVAEGVETEKQSCLLRVLSCDEMQGFLFSKPLPAGIFESGFLAAKPQGESPVILEAHT